MTNIPPTHKQNVKQEGYL